MLTTAVSILRAPARWAALLAVVFSIPASAQTTPPIQGTTTTTADLTIAGTVNGMVKPVSAPHVGDALNFDGPGSGPVREFFLANARYWIDEFHMDGLRLDATQSIVDESPRHIIADIVRAVMRREELGTTGIGHGIAIPHSRHPSVDRLIGTLALSRGGLPFESLDGEPVYVFFLLVSPQERPGDHLRALEWLKTPVARGDVPTLGAVLGVAGVLDSTGMDRLEDKSLVDVARAYVGERLEEAAKGGSPEALWLKRHGFDVLLGLAQRALTHSAQPWEVATRAMPTQGYCAGAFAQEQFPRPRH